MATWDTSTTIITTTPAVEEVTQPSVAQVGVKSGSPPPLPKRLPDAPAPSEAARAASAGKSTAWITENSGAHSASGRKRALVSESSYAFVSESSCALASESSCADSCHHWREVCTSLKMLAGKVTQASMFAVCSLQVHLVSADDKGPNTFAVADLIWSELMKGSFSVNDCKFAH